MPRQTVFFHIPKTAGSTLTSIFTDMHAPDGIFDTAETGTTQAQRNLDFIALPEEKRAAYGLVTGHLEMPLVDSLPGKPFVLTFLRHPVQRIVSMYNFIARTPSHHLHNIVADGNLGLGAMVRRLDWVELHNGMTARLAGVVNRPLKTYEPKVLKQAIFNLERHFSFVGFQEQFNNSLFALGKIMGLEPERLLYVRRNVSAKAAKIRPKPGDLDAVRAHNAMDQELFDYAMERFLPAISQVGREHKKELAAFKKALKAKRNQAKKMEKAA